MWLNEYDIEGMQRVVLLLKKHSGERLTIIRVSQEAGMSVSKFKIVFKFYSGHAFSHFLFTERLNMAYELVVNSYHSPKKIAYNCGYKFLSHFNEAFKKRFLISVFRLRRGR